MHYLSSETSFPFDLNMKVNWTPLTKCKIVVSPAASARPPCHCIHTCVRSGIGSVLWPWNVKKKLRLWSFRSQLSRDRCQNSLCDKICKYGQRFVCSKVNHWCISRICQEKPKEKSEGWPLPSHRKCHSSAGGTFPLEDDSAKSRCLSLLTSLITSWLLDEPPADSVTSDCDDGQVYSCFCLVDGVLWGVGVSQ